TADGNIFAVSYKGGTGNDVTLTATTVTVTPLPHVADVTVNNGAVQRSRVTQMKVTFDQVVTLPANAVDAFQLKRQSDGAAVTLAAAVTNAPVTAVTLTFTGGPLDAGSLADGRYTL